MGLALKQNSINAWIVAARPKTLGAMACPIFIGGSFALRDNNFNGLNFLAILSCGLLLQLLANIVNDYGDFIRGGDTKDRLGPARAMQRGLINTPSMQKGILFTCGLIIVLGFYIASISNFLILLPGAFAIIMAFWYTLGRYSLARSGLSELIVLYLFGPIPAVMTYYVLVGSFSKEAWILGFLPGFLASALMLTNNLRDIKEDISSSKLTLAVRIGENFSRYLILFLIFLSGLFIILPIVIFKYSFIFYCSFLGYINIIKNIKILLEKPISKKYNLFLSSIGIALYKIGFLVSLSMICEKYFIL